MGCKQLGHRCAEGFAYGDYEQTTARKRTKRERFLAQMEAVVPWKALIALIEPCYPKARSKGSRPPYPLETMLRIHLMQQWYDLSAAPSDSTFRLLLAQLDVEGFEALLQQWMAAQPGVTDTVDTLVCEGKTLRGSIAENASGAVRFIAQVSLYSNALGVAITQSTYATDTGGEIAALRQLLDRVELEGLLVQADALHANRGFFSTSSSVAPTS